MVGNKIIAAIRSDGRVYPLDDGGGGGIAGTHILNTNNPELANLVNMKFSANSGGSQQNLSDTSDIIMNNNRIQASVMDLGKKLLQCARDNDIEGVAAMIRKGAPFASDWLGMTAIHFAAMNNWYDICKLLLTSGINKDARTKVDRTPLHFATFYGHERIAALLIEYQSALNPRDMLRMTPLHWAVQKRYKNIVRLLLKHNADVTAISKFGKTPIALAVLTEQADILQELENARQLQQSKKYNDQHEHLSGAVAGPKQDLFEKETNDAVNSIMGQAKDEDEPLFKKIKICLNDDKVTHNDFEITVDNLEQFSDDNSAVNLLKSHGISMIKDDEHTSNNLLTTALQNGRQLILSEGGKLLLNEAKRMSSNKDPEPVKVYPTQTGSPTFAPTKVKTEPSQVQKFRPNIVSKSKDVLSTNTGENNNNEKQYKNIRIISLNDFKKLYGTGNFKSMPKIENSSNKSQMVKVDTGEKRALVHKKSFEESTLSEINIKQDDSENPDDDEESDLPPNIVKVSAESEQEDSSDIEAHQTAIIHPPVQSAQEQHLLPTRFSSNTNNTRLTYTRSPSISSTGSGKLERTPIIPLLTIPEICRQLLEMRKQNDELRRKYEIAQKENEDLRYRLERVETLLLVEHTEDDYLEI